MPVGGSFTFEIVVPPDNDDLNNSIPFLSEIRSWRGAQNVDATTEVDEPVHGGLGNDRSVWFAYNSQHDGTFTFNVDRVWGDIPSTSDVGVAIYKGGTFDDFGDLVLRDAGMGSASLTVTFAEADAYDDFVIVFFVTDPDHQGGFTFSWDVASPPANDTFENAEAITASGSLTGFRLNRTVLQLGDDTLDGYEFADGNRWWKYVPSADGTLEVRSTVATVQSQDCIVWKGTEIESLLAMAHMRHNIADRTCSVPVKEGETYYIQVTGNPTIEHDLYWDLLGVGCDYSDAGGSYGAGSYETVSVATATGPCRHDSLYIRFYAAMSSGDWAGSSGNGKICKIFDTDGTLIDEIHLQDWGPRPNTGAFGYGNGQAVSSTKITTVPALVELYVTTLPSTDYATSSKYTVMLVNGEAVSNFNRVDYSLLAIGSVQIGNIDDPYGYTLDITDLRVKHLSIYESVPLPTGWTDPESLVINGSGYISDGPAAGSGLIDPPFGPHGMWMFTERTSGIGSIIADPTSKFERVISASTSSGGYPAGQAFTGPYPELSTGVWVHFTTIGTCNIFTALYDTHSGFNGGSYGVRMNSDGRLVLIAAWFGNQSEVTAHRKFETGDWHWVEVYVERLAPRVEIRWWIDGEEQAPLKDDRTRGLLYAIGNQTFTLGIQPVGGSTTARGYVGPYVVARKGPVGPITTLRSTPDESGTHDLGVLTAYTDDSGTEKFIKSNDDGATYSSLGATEDVSPYIDEWPETPFDSGDSMIGQANRDGYIEFKHSDVSGDFLLVKAMMSVRSMHIMNGGLLLLHTFSELEPNNPDQTPTGSMPSQAVYQLPGSAGVVYQWHEYADSFTNQGVSNTFMSRAPDGQPWDATKFADMFTRWGYAHFDFGGAQQGNALYAHQFEVLVKDDPGSTAAVAEVDDPRIWVYTPHTDTFGNVSGDTSGDQLLDSCMAWPRNSKAVDPNMKGKVWFLVDSELPFDNNIDLYWRMLPAYKPSPAGFDGTFQKIEDVPFSQWRWFNAEWWGAALNRQQQFDDHWANPWQFNDNLFDYDSRVPSDAFIYDPCGLGSLVDEDGNITFEVYWKDSYGVESNVVQNIVKILPGDCCIGKVSFSHLIGVDYGTKAVRG